MKRNEAMIQLVLKNDITSNRARITEDPCTSNHINKDLDNTNTQIQLEADKENFRVSNNTPIPIIEQIGTSEHVNNAAIGKNVNTESNISSSNSSSSSSSDSSSSSSSSSDDDSGEDSDDSVQDPNFVTEQVQRQDSTDESDFKVNEQNLPLADESALLTRTANTVDLPGTSNLKTRKRLAKPSMEWKQNKSKILRNSGAAYVTVKNVQMRGKCIKPPCGDKCRLKCSGKITDDERLHVFEEFWGLKDITRQREFINQNMTSINRKYRYTTTAKGRMPNNAFYFNIMGQKIKVCKTYFMNTLDINSRVINTVIAKRTSLNTVEEDKRGKHQNHHNLPAAVKDSVRNHINSIPRIESHYLRNQTSRDFIEGGKTISDLHRDYKEDCIKNNEPYANYVMYAKIFNTEYNLGFFIPKKDRCEFCVAYENARDDEKLKLEEKYLHHQQQKTLSRQEKQLDKENESDRNIVAVYDLQAVLPVPKGDVSVFYYKSKLNCLNFTITDLKNKRTECYFWHEGAGNRGSDEIESCLLKYVEKVVGSCNKDSNYNLTFYSDNCVGQNKNKFIIALYVYCVLKFKNLDSITHKYLISGHTQNEGDSVHSVIEKSIRRNLKSGPIYVPSQYAQIIRSAKKTGEQYSVNELSFHDFISLKDLMSDIRMTIGSIKINEVKVLKYSKQTQDVLYYKKSYSDDTFLETKLWRKAPQTLPELKATYVKPIPLNERKRNDLLSLVNNNHVPQFYLPFYQHVCQIP